MTAPSDKELLDYMDQHLASYNGPPHDTCIGRIWVTIRPNDKITFREHLHHAIERDEARRADAVTRRFTE